MDALRLLLRRNSPSRREVSVTQQVGRAAQLSNRWFIRGTECCSGHHPCAIAHRCRPYAPVPHSFIPLRSSLLRTPVLQSLRSLRTYVLQSSDLRFITDCYTSAMLHPSEPHGAPAMSAYRPSSLPRLSHGHRGNYSESMRRFFVGSVWGKNSLILITLLSFFKKKKGQRR